MSLKNSNLLSIKQFNQMYPVFSIGGLRALIFSADKNGFNKVYNLSGGISSYKGKLSRI